MFLKNFTTEVDKIKINCPVKLSTVSFKSSPAYDSVYIPEATEKDVREILSRLPLKGPGFDKIRLKDLRNPNFNIEILTTFINNSITEGVVPEALKLAIIKPIFKGGDKNSFNNYRPISILSSINKILEKYIHNHLLSFLTRKKLLSKYQYGFIKSKGTKDALERFAYIVNSNLDKNFSIIALFIDFRKAFETLDIDILLNKLENIGVRGHILTWFKSYLRDRKVRVQVNNTHSDTERMRYGVPQGSILGPLLFLIYINDVVLAIKHCKVIMYADDIVLISTHKIFETCHTRLQLDFSRLNTWSHDNSLIINKDKTSVMYISSMSSKSKVVKIKMHSHSCIHCNDIAGDVNCNCSILEQVDKYIYLGIVIDEHLKFPQHIDKINKKMRIIAYQIYMLKDIVHPSIKLLIYNAMVQSILRYGITVWGMASKTLLSSIIRNQKRILKLIDEDRGKHCVSTELKHLCRKYKVLPADQLMKWVILMENYYKKEYKIPCENTHNMTKRHSPVLKTYRYCNLYGKRLPTYYVPQMFNCIPKHLADLKGMAEVKREILTWLLDGIKNF
jgi:hypothetical protein